MPFDRFMIAPPDGGLQNDLLPWLIPDKAFARLTNAYVFRGRVRKRFGSTLMNTNVSTSVAQLYSRLRINVGTTDVDTGDFGTAMDPEVMPGAKWAIGQQFSVGSTIFTVYQDNGATYTTGVATATYDTANGNLVITGNNENPEIAVYFYPSTPVMGLISYETDVINNEPVYAFDTQFSYFYSNGGTGGWERLGTMEWTGSDSQFFWGYTYRGITNAEQFLFVTNNNYPDRLNYWDGSDWNSLSPIVNNTNRLYTSKIIVPFKNRLIALNVTESVDGTSVGTTDANTGNFNASTGAATYAVGQNFVVGNTTFTILSIAAGTHALGTTTQSTGTWTNSTTTLVITGNGLNPSTNVYYLPDTSTTVNVYFNRCRYSQDGDPTAVNAWEDIVPGKGGYVDAPTSEQIITCEFLKDRLIVYFERSTWELAFTGNTILPFVWQQINTELGAESTFSVIPFDKVVLGIGNVGIHACNGSNVERIDSKIPDEVFDISNTNSGVSRTYGIRDYFVEQVYWALPDPNLAASVTYPNRVLVYNYKTGTWAFNDDSITCFGYYQNQLSQTWASIQTTWEETLFQWNTAIDQAQFRQIIAGNQQGFIFVINPEIGRNSPALQITKMVINGPVITITSINHNLPSGTYVVIENSNGVDNINGNIYQILNLTISTFNIYLPAGAEPVTGVYTGGGTVARVSNIDILTKQYNFYVDKGRNSYIARVDFLVDKTTNGEITVDTYVSSTNQSQLYTGGSNGSLLGTGVLETYPYALVPLEKDQDRLWHPVYLQAEGECVQLRLNMSDIEIRNPIIAWSNFELHAMIFNTSPTASRLQ